MRSVDGRVDSVERVKGHAIGAECQLDILIQDFSEGVVAHCSLLSETRKVHPISATPLADEVRLHRCDDPVVAHSPNMPPGRQLQMFDSMSVVGPRTSLQSRDHGRESGFDAHVTYRMNS